MNKDAYTEGKAPSKRPGVLTTMAHSNYSSAAHACQVARDCSHPSSVHAIPTTNSDPKISLL